MLIENSSEHSITKTSFTKENKVKTVNLYEVGPTTGLVAYYPFNGDTLDYSGDRNDLTNDGADIAQGLRGKECYHFMLANTDEMEVVPLATDFSVTLSISVFAKFDSLADWETIVHGHTTNAWDIGYGFFIGSANVVITVPGISINTAHGLSTGVWYHLGFSYDDNATPTTIFYVDGKVRATAAGGGSLTTDDGLTVGAVGDQSWYLDAYLQDLRLYNTVLTEKEMYILYRTFHPDVTTRMQINNDGSINVFGEIKEKL